MAEEKKTYVLCGNHYWQGKPAYIQMKEVITILGPVFWDKLTGILEWLWDAKKSADIKLDDLKLPEFKEIESFLQDNLPDAMARVVIPEGKTAKDRDFEQARYDLEYSDWDMMERVLLDFLSLSGLLSRLQQVKTRFFGKGEKKPAGKRSAGKASSTSSAAETSGG